MIAQSKSSTRCEPYVIARWALMGGIVATLILDHRRRWSSSARFIERRITGPAQRLAVAAEAVAAGDLSKKSTRSAATTEIGRLARGVSAMIDELRRLADGVAVSRPPKPSR